MDTSWKASIERECQKLSIAYANYLDLKRYEEFAELFGDSGELAVGGLLKGRREILKSMANRSDKLRSRHVLTNILIDVVDEKHATGITYLSLYRHIGPESLGDQPIGPFGPAAVGHYSDSFTLTDEGWRFSRRDLAFAFQNKEYFEKPKRA